MKKEVKIEKHWSGKTYNVDLISWQKNGEGVSFGRAFDVSKKEAKKVAEYNSKLYGAKIIRK
tara:strand:+ start:429 stop:614 length:186 start_codon:yes stop_codon:yes gene_type:complete